MRVQSFYYCLNLWYNMGREIQTLQPVFHLKVFSLSGPGLLPDSSRYSWWWSATADFMILTIKAMKIAAPKKDITDSIFPAYDRSSPRWIQTEAMIKTCICSAVSKSPSNLFTLHSRDIMLQFSRINLSFVSYISACFHSVHWNM